MSGFDEDERRSIRDDFSTAVNMTPAALRRWLDSDESRSVGMTASGDKVTTPGDGEAVGHHMGERILQLKGTRHADLDEEDYRAMRKVVGYVHRHLAQRPQGDVTETRWRQSLMNWGHDPLRR
ncbi:DUF3140 domain-containing protein [Stutzerimonas stutzeri]|uniref:DUF3140 domain-containing protein n=1 Tax=Stutzerimonas stutzeri TaxID=316 RepID=UPI001C2E6AF6|nr:DUF3140 domain-containing protein [Stutzerimonas stutzeri]